MGVLLGILHDLFIKPPGFLVPPKPTRPPAWAQLEEVPINVPPCPPCKPPLNESAGPLVEFVLFGDSGMGFYGDGYLGSEKVEKVFLGTIDKRNKGNVVTFIPAVPCVCLTIPVLNEIVDMLNRIKSDI